MNPERLQLKSRVMTWWKRNSQTDKKDREERTKAGPEHGVGFSKGRVVYVPTQYLSKVDGDSFHTAQDEENKSILTRSQVLIDEDPSHLSMKSESILDQFKDTESSHRGANKGDQEEFPNKKENKAETQQTESQKELNEWWNQNLITITEILGIALSINQYRDGGLKSEVIPIEMKIMIYRNR